jgi:post-segregation antitoxin (ccd killing protein)
VRITYVEIGMNLVLAVDEQLAERARVAAQAIGKSLNQAVRDDLEQLAGRAQLEANLAAFERSVRSTPGRFNGWKFNRDEMNERA